MLQYGPPSCVLPNKVSLSPSVWSRREYIWELNWKESLLIYFENWQGAPYSHRQCRDRMMNTFKIVNIALYMLVRDSLENKSMFLSTSKSNHGIPYSYTCKVNRG